MAEQSEQERAQVQAILKRWGAMKSDRVNWESHWDEVSKFVIPRKDDIYGQNIKGGGEKKTNRLFDATAIQSNELLSAALHAMLTNPTSLWFTLTTGNPDLDRDDNARRWLQLTTQDMHNVLNNSNFQTEVHETYNDLGSFGTGLMRIEEDDQKVVRFHSRPIYEAWIAENNKQIVDIVYRKFKWELRQIVQKFGIEALPGDMAERLKTNGQMGFKQFEILHCVHPEGNEELAAKKGGPLKIESAYIMLQGKCILGVEGFMEMPYVVPRWTKISGEVYGRSPAMKSLPDIKMLNQVVKTVIRSAQKMVDPPLQMPDDGTLLPLRTMPNGINYYRAGTKDRIEPLLTGGQPNIGFDMMADLRQRIRSAFFIDQLQLQEGPQMTATEVLQRTEEKLRLMGPILGRQQFEFLRPLLDRVFSIMRRKGELREAPEILRGRNVEFQYSSQIVRAQKLNESQNFLRAIDAVAPIVQADPSSLDNIDADKMVRHALQLHGVPQDLLRSSAEIAELREARAQAQQAAQQNQQELDDSEKIQKAGPTVLQAVQ